MILRTRHTGLVVNNVNLSVKFYESLGFTLWKQEVEHGEFISTVVGIPEVNIETAKLKAPDGSMVELLQYHSHPDFHEQSSAPSNRLGCSHIAFTVENLELACEKIVSLGGDVVNAPVTNPSETVKVAYCHDIDGILIELVEEII